MKLNEKIKNLREKVGVSQTDLAKSIMTNQNNISRWEDGSRKPSFSNRLKLSKIFNINLKLLQDMSDHEEIIIQLEELFILSISDRQSQDIERILAERETDNHIKAREISELLGVESTKVGKIKTIIQEYIGQ